MRKSRIVAVSPTRAVPGGRIAVHIENLTFDPSRLPEVRFGHSKARVVFASAGRVEVLAPVDAAENGRLPVRVDGVQDGDAFVEIGVPVADELHQIDNPAFDPEGNLYVTYSGSRGEQVPVSIFRIDPNGVREPFSTQIVNPTSIAVDPEGRLYVSSRFEGAVYRLDENGSAEPFVTDLGIACGLVFAPDGTLFVGDRSGTIFKVAPDGRATTFVSLPSSVAAFHLALAKDGTLFVTGPTLASYDALYAIDPQGHVTVRSHAFGRPQGIAFDPAGALHVVDALAGSSAVYRIPDVGDPELAVTGSSLVGLAFRWDGAMVVCSGDTAYQFQ
jgi:sugar lactone lactonase YvrE